MVCERIALPSGGAAIVCGPRQRCACGRPAALLCDWKVPARKSGTCDAPICTACAIAPTPGKDLCQTHAVAFETWKGRRAARGAA